MTGCDSTTSFACPPDRSATARLFRRRWRHARPGVRGRDAGLEIALKAPQLLTLHWQHRASRCRARTRSPQRAAGTLLPASPAAGSALNGVIGPGHRAPTVQRRQQHRCAGVGGRREEPRDRGGGTGSERVDQYSRPEGLAGPAAQQIVQRPPREGRTRQPPEFGPAGVELGFGDRDGGGVGRSAGGPPGAY